jgi:hypothetical protein
MTRLIPPALALAFALSCSAVWGEPTDWAIEPGTICSKSEATCREAVKGWLWPDLRGIELRCEPHPGCFEQRSLCIQNYNCEHNQRTHRIGSGRTDPCALTGLCNVSGSLRGIVIADPNRSDNNSSRSPESTHLKLAQKPLMLVAGIILIICSSKLLFYSYDRGGKFFYAVFICGFPFFCFGGILIVACFLSEPPPIFGFSVGSWH